MMGSICDLMNCIDLKIVTGLTVIAIGWYLNDPIPEGFSSRIKLRILNAIMKIVLTVLWTFHVLGIMPYEKGLRKIHKVKKVCVPGHITIEDDVFDGVQVRLYKPKSSAANPDGRPGLIYIHGGGWIMSTTRHYDIFMLDFMNELDIFVMSVEYRLAPEHKFPAPFLDSLNATKYFLSNAKSYGVDPQKIAIIGDSAGGTLAAAVSLKLRDDKFTPMPIRQVLIYPALQALDFSLPSFVQNKTGPVLTVHFMAFMWSLYATGSSKYMTHIIKNTHTTPEVKKRLNSTCIRHDDVTASNRYKPYRPPNMDIGDSPTWNELKDVLENPYFSPLIAPDLSGLPDAYIFTCQYDILRDDGQLYAKRLQEAGVNVVHVNGPRGIHGIAPLKRVFAEGQEFFDGLIPYLRNNLF